MRFLILVLLALTSQAHAWCTMPPPANPTPGPATPIPNTPAACWPSFAGIGGSGKGFLQRDFAAVPGATSEGGSCWGWWCVDAAGVAAAHTHCALDRYLAAGAKKAIAAALTAPNPSAALQAVADQYAVTPADGTQTNDYNCLHIGMLAALQVTKPDTSAAPVYKVPANGSAVYPVVNGKPGVAIAGKRAPGGALCGTPLISAYGYTYGPYAGGAAGEVALCQKQP
ncbi:MAG TPA: hypothetical protein PLL72_03815 [Burkholderiaceae bacterium]|nr:hypothetical protein [Burkholderiaceae bacterium]